MTRSHKIGWIVLVLAVLFMLWRLPRLRGQGFGSFSHDQPYLAADRTTAAESLPPDMTSLYRWWHAADLSTGTVTSWTDRIAGSTFSAVVAAEKPVATNSYVEFTADQRLTNKASGLDLSTTKLYVFVIGNVGTAGTRELFGSGVYYYPCWRFGFGGGANLEYRQDASTTDGLGAMPTANERFDFAVSFQGQYGAHTNFYAGTVLSTNTGNMDSLAADITMGNSYDMAPWSFRGRIFDILVYTNLATVPTTVSNAHTWQLNRYGTP